MALPPLEASSTSLVLSALMAFFDALHFVEGWFSDGLLASVFFCNVLHSVGVPGGVIAPSGLVWVLRLAFFSQAAFCTVLHSVGVPGGVIAPSCLVGVLRSAFYSLVVWAVPWVLSVSMALCGALHSVGVPGGVIAPSGLGWMFGSASR